MCEEETKVFLEYKIFGSDTENWGLCLMGQIY